jgi:hypothetical protein
MVYTIISNIGLAIMMIYIYFRYSYFRITSAKEISELRVKNDNQTAELRNFDAKLLSSIKNYQDRIEELLIEVGKVRQEKEKEVEVRSEIEKKYEILAQKNNDYELVHNEITNAIMNIVNDTHETAKNLGKDLFEKISTTYKNESLENQKIMSRINQNVADFVAKFNQSQTFSAKKNEIDFYELFPKSDALASNNLIIEAVDIIKNKGLVENKDFFLHKNFDNIRAKQMLADLLVIKNQTLSIHDFKATNYFFEYLSAKSPSLSPAELQSLNENFVKKFIKYLQLISHQKYYESINNLLISLGLNYNSYKIYIGLSSRSELRILKDFRLLEKIQETKIEIINLEDFEKFY